MVEKIYFVANGTENLDEAIEALENAIPCFITREYVEMDYSKIIINARVEDLAFVEKSLADFV